LRHAKEQIEYIRIQGEYDYIKKRALVNYLTNEKLNVEAHFHQRTYNMLKSIQNYENQNLKNHLKQIATGSLDVINKSLSDPSKRRDIEEAAFQSALKGIRSGQMAYESDPLLPILQDEMNRRITQFKGLSKEEEGKLLSLTADQRRIIADQDRKAKNEYLA
jgi:hypothetical protein